MRLGRILCSLPNRLCAQGATLPPRRSQVRRIDWPKKCRNAPTSRPHDPTTLRFHDFATMLFSILFRALCWIPTPRYYSPPPPPSSPSPSLCFPSSRLFRHSCCVNLITLSISSCPSVRRYFLHLFEHSWMRSYGVIISCAFFGHLGYRIS